MPKQRKDKTQGPDKKKSYKYPKKEESMNTSHDSNEIDLEESKKEKKKSYKYPKEEESIDSSQNMSETEPVESKKRKK